MTPRSLPAPRRASALAVITGLALLLAAATARAQTVPPNFVVESYVPGDAFIVPTGIAFLPDGRLLVAEKAGVVWIVKNGVRQPTPLWDGNLEVLNNGDRGLLDVAVDPNYFVNHWIYLLYAVDPDSNGVDDNTDCFGRLTRYQVSFTDSSSLVPGSRTILMGTSWNDAPIDGSTSHSIGSLRWGSDGSLLFTAGDGASFTAADYGGLEPSLFQPGLADPYRDIGAFRAQWIGDMNGKLMRINPANGHGYASNPFADGNLASARSKIYAYGMRNPFRFSVRPGSGAADTSLGRPGTLYIGDVGWYTWEEVNIAPTPGMNFGWPCFEGPAPAPDYPGLVPSHGGCDSVGTAWDPSPTTLPAMTWNHNDPNVGIPPGFIGNAVVGGIFYTGTQYPPQYQNAYFFGDYGQNWIRMATVDSLDHVTSVQDFGTLMDQPVDFAAEPATGNLVYVSILTGEIRRIRYGGGGGPLGPPVAVATATPNVGAAPLTVNFSSFGSFARIGGPIATTWAFGDQSGSTAPNPVHVYQKPGTYQTVLTVTDTTNVSTLDTTTVIVASRIAFPTAAVLDSFARPDGPLGTPWTGNIAGLSVTGGALTPTTSDPWAVWNGATFGPTQEVYVTFDSITATAPEHDLMLKVQGTDWHNGYIEARYDATVGQVAVTTYTPATAWVARGTFDMTFAPGDQYGARAYANGTIEVYKNGVVFGTCSAGDWPYAASGGNIGLLFYLATSSRLGRFGGGDAVLDSRPRPTLAITSPLDGAFYAVGDTIRLARTASSAIGGPLTTRWDVNIHHNNHIHPDTFTSDSASAFYLGANHDDGTGVFDEIVCTVTDTAGVADSAKVDVWPEIDLSPAALWAMPAQPAAGSPLQVTFTLRNLGRMPAPRSHWVVSAGGVTLAQGDTIVAGLDSLELVSTVPPATLAAGTYTLRVTADSLNAVHETNETNNAMVIPLTVVAGVSGVGVIPHQLALSGPRPNPSAGQASFSLDLPRAARVDFTVYDLQGRAVWRDARALDAGRWDLRWPGTGRSGAPVGPGVYLARVTAGGTTFLRRVALLR